MIYAELQQLERDLSPVWEALTLAAQTPDRRMIRRAHRALSAAWFPYRAQLAAKSLDRACPNGRDVFANMIDGLPKPTRRITI